MIIIGITGSIGMGKTTISSMLKFLGIPIFDSDKHVKYILEEDNFVINKIHKIWPDTITLIKRKKIINKVILGDRIFENKNNRIILEKIIHPIVKNKRNAFLHKHKSVNIIGLDVPLLYETGTDKICDYVFLVNALESIQRKRVLARPNMTKEKFEQIKFAQWSYEKKKKKKPFIINTSYGKLLSFIILLRYLLIVKVNGKIKHD